MRWECTVENTKLSLKHTRHNRSTRQTTDCEGAPYNMSPSRNNNRKHARTHTNARAHARTFARTHTNPTLTQCAVPDDIVTHDNTHKISLRRKRVDNHLLSLTTSTLIGDHSGLVLGRGRTICYQIEVHQSDLRTQICCSHVQEFLCLRHSVENSKAREFACSGGANELSCS